MTNVQNNEPTALKFLDDDMIKNIVLMSATSTLGYDNIEHFEDSKQISLTFDSAEKAEEYERNFNNSVFNSINEYLISNNLEPSEFKRELSISFEGENNHRLITY